MTRREPWADMQSAAKHTPGPWRLDMSGNACLNEHYHCIDGGCRWHDETGEQRNPGFLITGFMSAADARLMAAAPELLELVRISIGNIRSLGPAGALDGVQPYTPYREWLAQLEAVYTKATGVAA